MRGGLADIVVVEPQDSDAELLDFELRKSGLLNSLYRIRTGKEALDYIHKREPYTHLLGRCRLVVLRFDLPTENAEDVLHALRAGKPACDIPVVVLTQSRAEQRAVEHLKLEGVRSLSVPVVFSGFAEAVAQLGLGWAVMSAR